MLNPRLAARYAKSLIDLSIETGQLQTVFNDMQYLQMVSKANRDFVTILKSPIITPDKKQAVLDAVTKGKVCDLTAKFNTLLIKKGRESVLPEIAQAFIEQYKKHEQIYSVKLTTAYPVSDQIKQEIVDKIRSQSNMKNIDITAEVDESLIGGFVLQVGDSLVDASIAYDLNTIKKQFLNNDFIYKIR
jgi:F-type H+-transporting ATPase subunit delta